MVGAGARCSREHGWSHGSDSGVEGLGWGTGGLPGLWELEGGTGGVLGDLGTAGLVVADDAGSDDLDGLTSGGVSSGHLEVHLGNGAADRSVSVFLVHVHSSSSGQVSQVNAVVSDASGGLLVDLAGGDDLTLNLSDLVLSLHEVPELSAGEDSVAFENSHSVKRWVWVLLGGQGTAHDVELSHLCTKNKLDIIQPFMPL